LSFAVKSQEITSVNQLDKVGKKTGKWVGYHENTQIKRYVGEFKNNHPIGQFTYYSTEGYITATVDYINDTLSSSVMYHENGRLMAKGKFINKLKAGKWFTYSRFGDLLNVFQYQKGILDGKQYLYYPQGDESNEIKVMEEYECTQGLKHGSWKQYYPLGTIKGEGKYVNGEKQGRFIYYFSNGIIDMKGSFVDDKKNGVWFFYNSNNSNMDEVRYKLGEVILSEDSIDEK